MLKFIVRVFFVCIFVSPVCAKVDKAARIAQIEAYFGNLKTFESDVVQQNPDGSESKGKFYLSRPDKFRIKYTEPKELIYVYDGSVFVEYDPKMDLPHFIPLDSTPASLFLQEKIKLSGDVTLRQLTEKNGLIYAELSKTQDPDAGSITLILNDKPISLAGWIIVDAQQNTTVIRMHNIKENQPIKENLLTTSRVAK